MGAYEKLREVICKKCEFYTEGEKSECYAFKLSRRLLEEGKISLEDLEVDVPEFEEQHPAAP